MRTRVVWALLPIALVLLMLRWRSLPVARAQVAQASPAEHAPRTAPPAKLAQLMRGIMLPNSNVIFYAENKNPADIPPAKNASAAVNPLEGTYGKWEAVENSSLAISEAANLLMLPGRVCSNGRPVPINNPDWPRLVDGVRSAGLKAYAAAQTKDQDKLNDAGDVLTQACSSCHVKYRDKENLADRCQ
jgi:hypothetical protein